MTEQDEWASLQDTWGESRPASAVPDVGLMIARARRERRLTVLVLLGEWAMMVVAAVLVAGRWQRVATSGYETLWLVFQTLLMGVIIVVYTWTRLACLHEPAGTNLRDWLALRRRRARLGLRLACVTRWTTVALLPAPLIVLTMARSTQAGITGLVTTTLVLAGGWWWAQRKRARMNAEIVEVDMLALEWLDEPPGPSGQTSRA